MSDKKPRALVNAVVGIVVQVVLNLVAGAFLLSLAGDEADHGGDAGVLYTIGYLSVAIAVVLGVCVVLLLRRVERARIPVAVIEGLGILSGLISLFSGAVAGIGNIVLGIVVLTSLFKDDTSAWLRPARS